MLIVALCAAGGGLLSALLGWADSHDPFDGRKFIKSGIFAILSGIGFALAYQNIDGVTIRDVFTAILGGSGVDSLSNRVMGSIRR